MPSFKDSAEAWFKDKKYWEGVLTGAVTTLFGEWVAIAASSALVNRGVIQPGRSSNTLQGIIDVLFGWMYYALFDSLGYAELGVISSAAIVILGIYKLIEALVGSNPYSYVTQKASLVGAVGMASVRPYTPPVVVPPTVAPVAAPAKPAQPAQVTMAGLPIHARVL
jgi:dolichol kinase